MAGTIHFTSTRLADMGKRGLLKPDEKGYYSMVLGGLNVHNSAGEYYTLDGARTLFERSSAFMRRVQSGCLKGELGHPNLTPGMTRQDYIRRLYTIDERNVSHHIKDVWLDLDYGKNNPRYRNLNLVAIMGLVKPSGPHAASLEASICNPDENVCFSIRAFTKDYYVRGVNHRVLDTIVCWDHVVEPGIANATKWDAPALEKHTAPSLVLEPLADARFTGHQLQAAYRSIPTEVALESSSLIRDTIDRLHIRPTIYSQW